MHEYCKLAGNINALPNSVSQGVPRVSRKVRRKRANTSHVLMFLRCTTRTYIFRCVLIFVSHFSYFLGKEVRNQGAV